MSPPSHSGSLSKSSESWNATNRAHFTSIWMTGRTITKHNCHLYKLSCILCSWCRDNAHWKGVMSSPAPLGEWCVNTEKRQSILTLKNIWKQWLSFYIYGFSFSYMCKTPTRELCFLKSFESKLNCSTLLPTHAAYNPHPLSTSPCHFFSLWVHGRVHGSPICRDIWRTRQALRASGPVWSCDLVSSLSASGSTGTEGWRGWRKRERGGTETEEGWEWGRGGIHAGVFALETHWQS